MNEDIAILLLFLGVIVYCIIGYVFFKTNGFLICNTVDRLSDQVDKLNQVKPESEEIRATYAMLITAMIGWPFFTVLFLLYIIWYKYIVIPYKKSQKKKITT